MAKRAASAPPEMVKVRALPSGSVAVAWMTSVRFSTTLAAAAEVKLGGWLGSGGGAPPPPPPLQADRKAIAATAPYGRINLPPTGRTSGKAPCFPPFGTVAGA